MSLTVTGSTNVPPARVGARRSACRAAGVVAGLVLALLIAALPQSADAAPNVVVVMTDDLSLEAFDVLADGGWLPNIKTRLIDEGVRFTNSFVTDAICCPSRATFLTGQYAHNHGVLSNQTPDPFRPGITWAGWFPTATLPGREALALPTWLKTAGYHTALIGKYLNGYGGHAPSGVADPATYVPPGWDHWQGLIDPTTYQVYDYTLNDNGTLVTYGDTEADYQTDVLAGLAVDYLQARAGSSQPFFLYLTPLAPHIEVLDIISVFTDNDPLATFEAGIRPAPRHEYLADGDGSNGELPSRPAKPSFNEADMSDKPSCPQPPPAPGIAYNPVPFCVGDRPLLTAQAIDHLDAQYLGMLASMLAVDDLVGAVLDELEASGKLADTVFVFTSDNGWYYGEHRLSGKEMPYDEGIRVPLVIRAPGSAAGGTSTRVVLNNDLAPTLAGLAEATPTLAPDGTSLVPLLLDPGAPWFRKRFLVEHWHIPSLLKFELATSFSVRALNGSQNFLYNTVRATPHDSQTVTHREYYDYNVDPYARSSFTLPQSVIDGLSPLLNNLRICRSIQCQFLEGL